MNAFVILEPTDFTIEALPEGLALNYDTSAEAKFTQAGWNALGDRFPLLVKLLTSGGAKIWAAHPVSFNPPYQKCPICHRESDLFGAVHHRPPPCFKCRNDDVIIIGDRDHTLFHCQACHNEWEPDSGV